MPSFDTIFDANAVPPSEPFEVLPAGKYQAQVIASEMRTTKDGTSMYLWLEFEVLAGEHAGRKLWDRLNLFHPNEQTKTIAQRALSALCHATGKLQIQASEALHDIPVLLTVRARAAKDGFEASNEIRGYGPVDATSPASPAPALTNGAPSVAKPLPSAAKGTTTYAWT